MTVKMFGVILFAVMQLVFSDDSIEPMVAFVCDKPAMYSRDHGHFWIKDDSTGCLKDPVDILNYCRKVFPTLDVRNVVEASEQSTVSNWCDFGESLCNKEFTVTPFRCLVGAFQSDALLVPEHCVFDHIHDSKLCTSFSEWNQTSMRSCEDRGMVQQSCAMLQPCGIDKFNGVEFVCCPQKQVTANDKVREIVVTSGKPKSQPQAPAMGAKVQDSPSAAFPAKKQQQQKQQQPQQQQQQQPRQKTHKWNEHEYYMKAKNDMQKHHHEKISQMMKDWTSARQRVQEMRARDTKASEKLNKEITSRFQKMYEAEEVESEMERKQLSLLHQQRVQAEINEKKESALDAFVDTLDDYNSDAGEVLKAMKKYVKTLHKDRMHAINHYQHLEDVDPREAESVRQDTAEHLRRVDAQLSDALNMLNRVPKFKNKIMKQIQDFLDAYHSMDSDAAAILQAQASKKEEKKQEVAEDDEGYNDEYDDEDDDDDDDDDEDEDDDDDEVESKNKAETTTKSSQAQKDSKKMSEKNDKESDDADDEDDDDENDDEDDDDEDSFEDDLEDGQVFEMPAKTEATTPVATETTRAPTTKSAVPVEVKSGFGDSESSQESKEEEKKKEEVKEEVKEDSKEEGKEGLVDVDYYRMKGAVGGRHDAAANVDRAFLSINQGYIKKTPLHTDTGSINAAVPLGLAVAGLTVFIVIVVGVVLMRRRHHQTRPLRRLGSLDLDQSADMGAVSPEERHVASMQMNGYENPTYRYFEQQSVSA